MELPDRVVVVEMSPRDGVSGDGVGGEGVGGEGTGQAPRLSATDTLMLVDRLTRAGLGVVALPALLPAGQWPHRPDAEEVLGAITWSSDTRHPVLVAGTAGLDRALAAGVRDLAVTAAASEAFSERHLGATIDGVLARLAPLVRRARRDGVRVRGEVAVACGCPYQGEVPAAAVAWVTTALFELGCDEVVLDDTVGVGTALQVQDLVAGLAPTVLVDRLTVRPRDLFGQGLANALAALDAGVRSIATGAGGLGGNAPAPSTPGDLATEDLLYALEGSGVHTGVDLEEVVAVTGWLAERLGGPPPSRLARAVLGRTRRP